MDVMSFKLIGGQELVAQLVSVTGLGYIVRNPLQVHVMRGPDGAGQLMFAQWSMVQEPSSDTEIYDHGLHGKPTPLLPEVAKSYMEQVTGLALPTPPSGRILKG